MDITELVSGTDQSEINCSLWAKRCEPKFVGCKLSAYFFGTQLVNPGSFQVTRTRLFFYTTAIFMLFGCAPESGDPPAEAVVPVATIAKKTLRDAYFGDTHVHTRYSFDAYVLGTRASPDDAYRYAKGAAIQHAGGFQMQINKPLDFLAVTDHANFLGVVAAAAEGTGPLSQMEFATLVREITKPEDIIRAFRAVGPLRQAAAANPDQSVLNDPDVSKSAWLDTIAAAERHNDPGTFTTFVAYEYTTTGGQARNLHRNVIFRGSKVPDLPFSRLDSPNPEDLWHWMDAQRELGNESLAIPHNANGSDGWMFQTTRFDGSPQDTDYAIQRMRNEPVVENTQVKGTSDTHPLLSPNDEWADFEIMPIRVGQPLSSQAPGSYVRNAWGRGLQIEENGGVNPFKFGVIGSSDTHNAAGSFEEDNFWSKTGLDDATPQLRGSVPLDEESTEIPYSFLRATQAREPRVATDGRIYNNNAAEYWGASGLAGVWAESNTREDIFAAFRRKETFSTSGPRIKVRFFGSASFASTLLNSNNAIEQAYAEGVPMGGDLSHSESAPRFLAWAAGDPDTVGLQRLQIIKGWLEANEYKEHVYDVSCSDGGEVVPKTHRCPDNGAKVDPGTCEVTPDKGASELKTLWQDPDFKSDQPAFYYVRVLENPKCRWSTWDAIRAGVAPRVDLKATIQDRAWSSPIWYNP